MIIREICCQCQLIIVEIAPTNQIGFATPHNLCTSSFSEIIIENILPFTIENFTHSSSHPIVPFGIVEEHPWNLFGMVFPTFTGRTDEFLLKKCSS